MNTKKPIKKLLHQIGVAVVNEAKDKAPVDTGELQASIGIIKENESEIIIGHKANPHLKTEGGWFYPALVHEGTGLFGAKKKRIKPKKAKALNTPYGYVKSIAGQKAQPYLSDAAKDVLRSNKISKIADSFADELGQDLVADIKKSLKNAGIEIT